VQVAALREDRGSEEVVDDDVVLPVVKVVVLLVPTVVLLQQGKGRNIPVASRQTLVVEDSGRNHVETKGTHNNTVECILL
jgi:hypothetical protein